MVNMWMVRSGDEEFLYDEFKKSNLVAIKWKIEDSSDKNKDEIKGLLKKKK